MIPIRLFLCQVESMARTDLLMGSSGVKEELRKQLEKMHKDISSNTLVPITLNQESYEEFSKTHRDQRINTVLFLLPSDEIHNNMMYGYLFNFLEKFQLEGFFIIIPVLVIYIKNDHEEPLNNSEEQRNAFVIDGKAAIEMMYSIKIMKDELKAQKQESTEIRKKHVKIETPLPVVFKEGPEGHVVNLKSLMLELKRLVNQPSPSTKSGHAKNTTEGVCESDGGKVDKTISSIHSEAIGNTEKEQFKTEGGSQSTPPSCQEMISEWIKSGNFTDQQRADILAALKLLYEKKLITRKDLDDIASLEETTEIMDKIIFLICLLKREGSIGNQEKERIKVECDIQPTPPSYLEMIKASVSDRKIDRKQRDEFLEALKCLYEGAYINDDDLDNIKDQFVSIGMELKIPYEQLRKIAENVKDDSLIVLSRKDIEGLMDERFNDLGTDRRMRLVVTGEGRSGKSSLILALCPKDKRVEEEMRRREQEDQDSVEYMPMRDTPRHLKAEWFVTETEYNKSKVVKILISDTRGFGEGKGRGKSDSEVAEIIFKVILDEAYPDCFLYVMNAEKLLDPVKYKTYSDKPLDAWPKLVDPNQLNALGILETRLKEKYGFYVPVLVVISRCDKIYDLCHPHQKDIEQKNDRRVHPHQKDSEQKNDRHVHLHEKDDQLTKDEIEKRNMKIAKINDVTKKVNLEVQEWANAFGTQVLGVVGVSTLKEWKNGGLVPGSEKYWKVESVWESLFKGRDEHTSAIIQARDFQTSQIVEKLAKDYIDKAVARTEFTIENHSEIVRVIAHLGQMKFSPTGSQKCIHDFIESMGLNYEKAGKVLSQLTNQKEGLLRDIIKAIGDAAIDHYILKKREEEARQRFDLRYSAILKLAEQELLTQEGIKKAAEEQERLRKEAEEQRRNEAIEQQRLRREAEEENERLRNAEEERKRRERCSIS